MKALKPAEFKKKLARLRLQIDSADRNLIQALAQRSRVVDKIGLAKKAQGQEVVQKSRWTQLVRDRKRQAAKVGVDKTLILEIFECIQRESIARQGRAKSKGKKS